MEIDCGTQSSRASVVCCLSFPLGGFPSRIWIWRWLEALEDIIIVMMMMCGKAADIICGSQFTVTPVSSDLVGDESQSLGRRLGGVLSAVCSANRMTRMFQNRYVVHTICTPM